MADNYRFWQPGDDLEKVFREIMEQAEKRRREDRRMTDRLSSAALTLAGINSLLVEDILKAALRGVIEDVVDATMYFRKRYGTTSWNNQAQEADSVEGVAVLEEKPELIH